LRNALRLDVAGVSSFLLSVLFPISCSGLQSSGITRSLRGTGGDVGATKAHSAGIVRSPGGMSEDPGGMSEDPGGMSEDPGGVTADPVGIARSPVRVMADLDGVT
jgi:hypothetical protein